VVTPIETRRTGTGTGTGWKLLLLACTPPHALDGSAALFDLPPKLLLIPPGGHVVHE
jgi:hypothetical protein